LAITRVALRSLQSVCVVLAALHLGVLGEQYPIAATEPVSDGSLLRLDTETAVTLFLGTDAVVSDETTLGHGCILPHNERCRSVHMSDGGGLIRLHFSGSLPARF